MRITEILTESQLEQLDEGPMLNKIGTTVGNVAGGVAKGVGAVAGGIAGLGSAFKKGFDRSKGIVGQGGDYVAPPDAPAPAKAGTPAPAKAAAPAAGGVAAPQPQGRIDPTMDEPAAEPASTTTPPSAADINAQGPKGTAPAKAQTGDAGKALAKTTAVVDKQQAASQVKANQTVYAQIKANVDKLDKKGKQQILQLLQKSMSAPAPAAAPAAAPGAATKRAAAAKAGATDSGAGAFGQMAQQLAKGGAAEPAAAQIVGKGGSKFNHETGKPFTSQADADAQDDEIAAARASQKSATAPAAAPGAPAAGGQKMTPQQTAALKGRLKAGAAPTSGQSGFNKFKANANAKGIATAGKINHGNALSEALAQGVELRKQQMFETGLAQGTISIFKK